MKHFWILAFLAPLVLYAYEFKPLTVSLNGGYEHQKINFSYRDKDLTNKIFVSEHLPDVNLAVFGISGQYLNDTFPYARADISYGLGWSGNNNVHLTNVVIFPDHGINLEIPAFSPYHIKALLLDVDAEIGLPFRLAQLTFIPLIGIAFERENFYRHQIKQSETDVFSPGNTIIAKARPEKKFRLSYLSGLAGIKIFLQPRPFSRVSAIVGYAYHFGTLHLRSRYRFDNTFTDIPPTVTASKEIHKYIKMDRYAHANEILISVIYGVADHWTIGMNFNWEYIKAKPEAHAAQLKEEDHETILFPPSLPTTLHNQSLKKISFDGFTYQTYSGDLEVAYAF